MPSNIKQRHNMLSSSATIATAMDHRLFGYNKLVHNVAETLKSSEAIEKNFPIVFSLLKTRLYLMEADIGLKWIVAMKWGRDNYSKLHTQISNCASRGCTGAAVTKLTNNIMHEFLSFIMLDNDALFKNSIRKMLTENIKNNKDLNSYVGILKELVRNQSAYLKALNLSSAEIRKREAALLGLSSQVFKRMIKRDVGYLGIPFALVVIMYALHYADISEQEFDKYANVGAYHAIFRNPLILIAIACAYQLFLYKKFSESSTKKPVEKELLEHYKDRFMNLVLEYLSQKPAAVRSSTSSSDSLPDPFEIYYAQAEKFQKPEVKTKIKTRKQKQTEDQIPVPAQTKPEKDTIKFNDKKYVPLDVGFFCYNKIDLRAKGKNAKLDPHTAEKMANRLVKKVKAKRHISNAPPNQRTSKHSEFFESDGKIKLPRKDCRATTILREPTPEEIAHGITSVVHEVNKILDHRADNRKK